MYFCKFWAVQKNWYKMQASVVKIERKRVGGGIKRRASTVPNLLNKRPFCYQFLIFKQITSLRASLAIIPPPDVQHQKFQRKPTKYAQTCEIWTENSLSAVTETDGRHSQTKSSLFFYRCTVHSDIHTVHSPTDAHLLELWLKFT